jgi:uncharacterized delta-60 repeat protein
MIYKIWLRIATALLISAFLTFSPDVKAASGDLDSTFGSGGRVTTATGNTDSGNASAVQPDGKIVVAGTSRNLSDNDFAVARYNFDGSLDTTFSGDGKVTTNLGSTYDSAAAVAIQSDWKIVAAGVTRINNVDVFALVRYNPDGTLDTTFGGDGIVTTNISGDDAVADIAIQTDGKIVAIGDYLNTIVTSETWITVARYNADGSLDTGFSADGKSFFSFGAGPNKAGGVALQTDGKIVVSGSSTYSTQTFSVARLTANGNLDTTFNGSGTFKLSLSDYDARAYDVAIQTDGKIVAVGKDTYADASKFMVIRLNSNGTLDPTFDGNGLRATAVGDFNDVAASVAIQADGRIVVSGKTQFNGSAYTVCAALRHNPDGSLDSTFDGNGIMTDPNMTGCETALTGDGKIVFGGTGRSGLDDDFSVTRHYSDGSFDTTFSGDGKTLTDLGSGDEIIKAVALQTDGKIVVAGRRENLGQGLLARYNADGALDSAFGSGGFVVDTGHGGHPTYFSAIEIQTDGKIVAAGYFMEAGGCTGTRPWIVRYNADGSRDTTFGSGGTVEFMFGCPSSNDSYGYLYGLAIQNGGKIVAVGSAKNASGIFDFAAARLNPDGSFDSTFSGDGMAVFPIGSGSAEAYSVTFHARSGRIVLAGYANSSTIKDFALVMLTSNGQLDWNFGSFGKVITNTGGDDAAYAVAFQADGKIIAAGRQANGANMTDFSLARYTANGALDTTFGGDGKVSTTFSAYYDAAFGIGLQADGKIIAAGYGADNNNLATGYNFALTRYNPNGALDTTFSGDGKQMTDFILNSDHGQAVAMQADGKILVAGYASNGSDFDIALARYLP